MLRFLALNTGARRDFVPFRQPPPPPHPLFSLRSQTATSQLAGFRNISQTVTTCLIRKPSFPQHARQCSTHLDLQHLAVLHPVLLSFPFLFVPEGLVMSFPTFLSLQFLQRSKNGCCFDNSSHIRKDLDWGLLFFELFWRLQCLTNSPALPCLLATRRYTVESQTNHPTELCLYERILDS